MTTVLLTGASGFIAKHILRELIAANYTIKASTRSEQAQQQVQQLFPHANIEYVHLDLLHDDGWDDALAGVDVLLHTASPFPGANPRDPQEVIRPAVDGTLRALSAAQRAGVQRVILTSSCVAIYKDPTKDPLLPSTRANWTDPDSPRASAYDASKTLAERAAWDFAAKHPELNLTTINPGVVFGPPMDEHVGTSLNLLESIYHGKMSALPRLKVPCVDVRDVARIHVLAIENGQTYGERFPATSGALSLKDIAVALKQAYPEQNISTREIPDFSIKALALISSQAKAIVGNIGLNGEVDGSDAPKVMGFEYLSPTDAVLASVQYLQSQ